LGSEIVLVVEGLEELQEALKQYPREWPMIARAAMGPGLAMMSSEARMQAPVDTGASRASIGSQIIMGSGSEIIGKVGSGLEYAPYSLEYGRGPGKMPPVAKIEEWAVRHGMPGAGFVIARAIGARGIKAPKVFTKTLEATKDRVVKLFEQGIENALKRLFK